MRDGHDHEIGAKELGIEVVAATEEERERMLPRHIRVAVLRDRALRLDRLAWLARGGTIRIESVLGTLELPTPKQAAIAKSEAVSDKGAKAPQ